jgi:hypothetical protein
MDRRAGARKDDSSLGRTLSAITPSAVISILVIAAGGRRALPAPTETASGGCRRQLRGSSSINLPCVIGLGQFFPINWLDQPAVL